LKAHGEITAHRAAQYGFFAHIVEISALTPILSCDGQHIHT
jgi:hypothetical protein